VTFCQFTPITTTTTVRDSDGNITSQTKSFEMTQDWCLTLILDDGAGGGGGAINQGGGGGGHIADARQRAKKLLSNAECAKFLKDVLTGLKQLPDMNTFSARFDALTIVPTPASDPYVRAGGRRATAHVDPYSFPGSPANTVVHVDNPNASDLAGTLLHEELHTYPYAFDDLDLAHAAGMMKDVTNPSQANENLASQTFSQEMNKHCHD
jgi:hypothetical protein